MPANVVKTPAEEKMWDQAKEYYKKSSGIPESSFEDKDWATVMNIFKSMKEKYGENPPYDIQESKGMRIEVHVMDGNDLITKMDGTDFMKIMKASQTEFLQDVVDRYNSQMEQEGSSQRAKVMILTSKRGKWTALGEGIEEARESSSTSTPWGKAQDKWQLAPGLIWYSTPGHGGLSVSAALARKSLSQKARTISAIKFGNAYWYEEDNAWVIPFYEQPEWAKLATKEGPFTKIITQEYIKKVIESDFPSYFEDGDGKYKDVPEFKKLQVGDEIVIDKPDAKPFKISSIDSSHMIISRDGRNFRFGKSAYFSRAEKVLRDGKEVE